MRAGSGCIARSCTCPPEVRRRVWHSEGVERNEKRRLYLYDIREVMERMNKIIKERDAKEKIPAADWEELITCHGETEAWLQGASKEAKMTQVKDMKEDIEKRVERILRKAGV